LLATKAENQYLPKTLTGTDEFFGLKGKNQPIKYYTKNGAIYTLICSDAHLIITKVYRSGELWHTD